MKKMLIVAFIVSSAFVACGGKKAPATTSKGSADMGSAAGSDAAGSGSAMTPEAPKE